MDDTPDRLDDDFTSRTVRDDEPADDTSGGPLSSGAGEGSGQDAEGAPDVFPQPLTTCLGTTSSEAERGSRMFNEAPPRGASLTLAGLSRPRLARGQSSARIIEFRRASEGRTRRPAAVAKAAGQVSRTLREFGEQIAEWGP